MEWTVALLEPLLEPLLNPMVRLEPTGEVTPDLLGNQRSANRRQERFDRLVYDFIAAVDVIAVLFPTGFNQRQRDTHRHCDVLPPGGGTFRVQQQL